MQAFGADTGPGLSLDDAAGIGHVVRVRDLLNAGHVSQNCIDNAMITAAGYGHVRIIRLLLDRGADTRYENGLAFNAAVANGYDDAARVLMDHDTGLVGIDPTLLSWAAGSGMIDVVRRCLELDFDMEAPHDDAEAPLTMAAAGGHGKVVSLLLDHGADPNAFDVERIGSNALIAAAGNGHLDTVRLLVEGGAELRRADEDFQEAITVSGVETTMRTLIEAGLDVTVIGDYPLVYAANSGDVNTCAMMISVGMRVSAENETYLNVRGKDLIASIARRRSFKAARAPTTAAVTSHS